MLSAQAFLLLLSELGSSLNCKMNTWVQVVYLVYLGAGIQLRSHCLDLPLDVLERLGSSPDSASKPPPVNAYPRG